MTTTPTPTAQTSVVLAETLDNLINRVQDIDNCYRSLAEKVGQLYMQADEASMSELTGMLDKPMRNASDNEQTFAAMLDDLRMKRLQLR